MVRCWTGLGAPRFAMTNASNSKRSCFGGARPHDLCNLVPLNAAARRRQLINSRLTGGQPRRAAKYPRYRTATSPRRHIIARGYRRAWLPYRPRARAAAQAGVLRNLKAIVLGTFIGGAEGRRQQSRPRRPRTLRANLTDSGALRHGCGPRQVSAAGVPAHPRRTALRS